MSEDHNCHDDCDCGPFDLALFNEEGDIVALFDNDELNAIFLEGGLVGVAIEVASALGFGWEQDFSD